MRVRLKHTRLARFLAESTLSQNHWALKIGLSRGHWSEIVNGKHPYLSPRTRQLLLDGLGLPFDELFEIVEGDAWTHQSGAEFQAALADRYLIDRQLGQGGMGTVYLAREVKHHRLVAVKVVSPEIVSGVGVAQFLKELRYTARLEHPNILTLLDSGEAAGYPYYVMPYVRAGSLQAHLETHGRCAPDAAVPIVRDVALGLSHAHAERIVHCDVKPANILLAPSHAYVADFGISRTLHEETRRRRRQGELDTSAGTPAYVSPEQASGDPDLDARSDIYSLGCVVYEMLTGRPPFTGRNTMTVVSRRFTDPVPNVRALVPDLPVAVGAVVEKAMAFDRRHRPASALEFAEALADAAAGASTLTARVTLAASRSARWLRRKAGLAGGGSARGGRVVRALDLAGRNLRSAVRSLRRNPGFSAVAILTLALGVGVNAAIFSVVNGVLFKRATVERPEELVELYRRDPDGSHNSVSHLDIEDIRDGVPDLIDGVAAYKFFTGQVAADGPPGERGGTVVFGQLVTGNYFSLLGVRPARGRFFVPEEDRTPETHPVVVLGHHLWRTRFGSDSSITGRRLRLNGRVYTVVGVAPESFPGRLGGLPVDVFAPMMMENHLFPSSPDANNLWATARLRPGQTPEGLTAALAALSDRVDDARGRRQRDWEFAAARTTDVILSPSLDGLVRAMAALLLAIVGLVLLVACTNLASFLLARATERRKEMAVRMALGASRRTILGQLTTESLVLGGVGGAAGLVAGTTLVGLLARRALPASIPFRVDFGVDLRVVAYTVSITLLASALFGLLPAARATRAPIAPTLREEAGSLSGGHRLNVRNVLVMLQMALSLVLLIGAGLFSRSLRTTLQLDLGFSTAPAGIVTVDLRGSGYGPNDYSRLYRDLRDAARATPGARDVAVADRIPATLLTSGITIRVPGVENTRGTNAFYFETSVISPQYFDVLGIPVTRGRPFREMDRDSTPRVVMFNEAAASRLWPDQDPLGRTVVVGGEDAVVVGVAANAKDRGPRERPRPMLYLPLGQRASPNLVIFARGPQPAARLAEDLRRAALALDPDLFVVDTHTLADHLGVMYYLPRMGALVLSALAALALGLGCLGLYGVVSYTVSRSAREMAIRMSLGATPGQVVKVVLRRGMRLALAGAALGLILALALLPLIDRFLLDGGGADLVTFTGVPLLLGAVALAATWLPARRASRVSPMETLRAE